MNNTKPEWKKVYKLLGATFKYKLSPGFYGSVENAKRHIDIPKVATSNGLTKAICNFIKWKGHYSNRINTQGQARVNKIPKFNISSGKIEYLEKSWRTTSTTRKGTADIDAIIHSKPVKIEVKIGRDKMSEHQIAEKQRVEAAGGIYYVAKTMEEFYAWYNKQFEGAPDDPDLYTTTEGY